MDTFNSATLNSADYAKGLRILYKNYNNYQRLSNNGNDSATTIIIDLNKALSQLSDKQQYAIRNVLIDGNSISDIAVDSNSNSDQVRNSIKTGLKKASKLLCFSNLYKLANILHA